MPRSGAPSSCSACYGDWSVQQWEVQRRGSGGRSFTVEETSWGQRPLAAGGRGAGPERSCVADPRTALGARRGPASMWAVSRKYSVGL